MQIFLKAIGKFLCGLGTLLLIITIFIACSDDKPQPQPQIEINNDAYSPKIEGFASIKWGDSYETIDKTINSRDYLSGLKSEFEVVYHNLKVGDYRFDHCAFLFSPRKGFYSVKCIRRTRVLEYFDNLKASIREKHGKPYQSSNKSTLWKSRDNNHIILVLEYWIGEPDRLELTYENRNLLPEAIKDIEKYKADKLKEELDTKQREEREKKLKGHKENMRDL